MIRWKRALPSTFFRSAQTFARVCHAIPMKPLFSGGMPTLLPKGNPSLLSGIRNIAR